MCIVYSYIQYCYNLYNNKSSKLVIGECWVSHITYKYGIMFKIYAFNTANVILYYVQNTKI